MALPVCVALMAQRPAATSVTVLPETVQMVGVVEAKLTARPDEAVAVTVNGGVLSGTFGNGAKLMVCASLVMVKAWTTGVAAA